MDTTQMIRKSLSLVMASLATAAFWISLPHAADAQDPNPENHDHSSICYGIQSTLCKGTCINPMSDASYCGASDDCSTYQVCESGEVCVLGVCKKAYTEPDDACAGDHVLCDGICVDPKKNLRYCGAKKGCSDAMACKSYHTCSEGACCIVFNDDGFKAYAVKQFDANHDERVCADEADVVTEISEPDEGFKDIVRLSDLNSFPNLKKIGKAVFAGFDNITNKDGSDKFKEFKSSFIEEVGDKAFYKTGMETVTMGALVTVDTSKGSEGMTFAECPNLKTVSFGKLQATSIHMFKDSKLLNKVTLSVAEQLSRGTFEGCESLTSLTAKKVQTLQTDVFVGTAMTSVAFSAATKIGFDENGNAGTTFKDNPNLNQIKLNAKGTLEVSPTFATSETAANCELILNSDKAPGKSGTPHATEAGEWPADSGLIWKKITYNNY